MARPPDLGELLAALRADGIPVGPAELTRLHHAFGTAPALDREGLRRFLACLLVKTPGSRPPFDQCFDAWCPDRPADWGPEAAPRPVPGDAAPGETSVKADAPEPFERPEPAPAPPRWPRAAGLLGALVLAGLLAYPLLRPPPTLPVQAEAPTGPAVTLPALPDTAEGLPANPAPRVWYWQAQIRSIEVPERLTAAVLGLTALLAALLAAGLWERYRRRQSIPPRLPPTAGGPAWRPLPPLGGSDTALLAPRERRALCWNIARFTAADLTRRLDEPATVAATARAGGLAQVRYRPARFPREVWLWLDEHCADPALGALADEIGVSLGRAGLNVRRGTFAGTPLTLWWRRDDHCEPSRLEGHRDQALVALLTDGAALCRALDAPLAARRLVPVLRQLRLWPHLVLVDFGPPGRLARRVRPLGLPVIRPRDLAAWLGGRETTPPAPTAATQGDLRLWAAACALGTDPPDPGAAQRLRRRLGLKLDPWALQDLQQDAADPGLRWPEPRRRELINWLLRAGPLDEGGIPAAGSPARLAIAWWRERYRAASSAQAQRQNRLLPWDRTGAQRAWALEDALLRLYLEPAPAVRDLQALAGADPLQQAEVRARLGELRAADQWSAAGPAPAMSESVRLTWRLGDLPAPVQAALAGLGFGGLAAAGRHPGLRPAPRLALSLGLLAGLALGAAGGALDRWLRPPGIALVGTDPLHDQPTLAAQTLRLVDRAAGRITLGDPRQPVAAAVPPGARVTVAWTWGPGAADNNPVPLRPGGAALVYRAGTLAQPIRPCAADWPARSLAVVQSGAETPAARRLAIRLLDSGTADLVLISPDWQADRDAFVGDDPLLQAHTRLLVVLPPGAPTSRPPALPAYALIAADDEALARWLAFPGRKPLEAAPAQVLARRGAMDWHGGPRLTEDPRTGIGWVQVCPGTFTQGSEPETDPKSQDRERPAHPVALDGFEIARTETTNAQYRRRQPQHAPDKDGALPAVNVNWQEARDFCRWAGGDLPTESQWELAARGGSIDPWSFGNDEERLGEFAWYADNSGSDAHAVAGKRPNPLGLYDMHGNAWEWVRDWYGPYREGVQVNPAGADSSEYRVLRGGSFFDPPEFLRSSYRAFVLPVVQVRFVGFRCVRVASPQP